MQNMPMAYSVSERYVAKRFFKLLEGGEVEIVAAFPAGVIGSTLDNLKASAAGEHFEWSELYPGFAKIAREEGFEAAAMVWEMISIAGRELVGYHCFVSINNLVIWGRAEPLGSAEKLNRIFK